MQVIIILPIYMKKYKKESAVIALGIFLLAFPFFVFGDVSIPNPLGYDTFGEVINAIVVFIRNVALAIAPIIFIIAGLMYFFAGGNPEQAKKATDLIKWAVIGLVIILIANGVTAVITNIMGVNN